MNIKSLKTHDEIAQSFDAFLELRPHLRSKEIFVAQVMEQYKEGYEIIAAHEQDEVVACIGFRFLTTLAWGKILYIDDLITKEKTRGKGYGKILLDHVIQIAREHLCKEVHLETGYARHAAHKVEVATLIRTNNLELFDRRKQWKKEKLKITQKSLNNHQQSWLLSQSSRYQRQPAA